MIEHRETLIRVIDDVMTNMFFLFPDLDDDGNQITDAPVKPDAIHVGIHFNTEHYLHIAVDRALLHEMAGNFMGLGADELTPAHLENMALETANILGGNLLVRIDPDHRLKLSIPEMLEASKLKDAKDWTVAFSSEGRVLRITPLARH